MKKTNYITSWPSLGAVCLSLVALPAWSQSSQTATTSSGTLSHVERAANLFNKELQSSDNQKVGKVNNLILDLESEHILYAVVNGDKGKVAVPPQIFGDTSGNTIRVNADKAKIEAAPQFTGDIDKPEELGQASFIAKVYEHFGQNEWWKGSTPANQGTFHNVHKLNDLIGMKVENVNNQTMGKVNNLVVDMPTGRAMYVVLGPDSSLNLGNNLYALPPDALTLSSDKKHLSTGIDQQKLASAPHFDKNSWPNLTDANFASQVYQYYGKQAWFGNTGGTSLQPTGR